MTAKDSNNKEAGMPSQERTAQTESTIESDEKVGLLLTTAGQSLAYVIVIIGYIFTILGSPHLTLFNFSLFTALNIGYCAILWWVARSSLPQAHGVIGVVLLALLAIGAGVLPLIGLQWDWLLYLVTLSLFFLVFPLSYAIGAGVLLYVIAGVNLGLIYEWNWWLPFSNWLSLLPAFAFVAIFSLVVQVLETQKARAELYLRQLQASNAELELAHRQLQAYANEVEELTMVRERTRVAREIHDSLGHYLSILNIQLETISKLQERDPARAAIEIAEARRVAAQSMQEVRNAVAALRPSSIASLSLPEALQQLGHEFEQSAGETSLTLDLETQLPQLSPDVQVAIYRAAQEALTNVRKHAQADKVLLRLRYEDEALELLVLDNGRGSTIRDAVEQGGGFGLVGLRERIELLGGHVEYGPSEQGGYRVILHVPIPASSQATSASHSGSGEKEKEAV